MLLWYEGIVALVNIEFSVSAFGAVKRRLHTLHKLRLRNIIRSILKSIYILQDFVECKVASSEKHKYMKTPKPRSPGNARLQPVFGAPCALIRN